MRRVHDFFQAVRDLNAPAPGPGPELTEEEADRDLFMRSMRVFSFLATRLFSYMKFFDADLPPDDERNYYMEREWRIIGGVRFSLGDVRRVLAPGRSTQRGSVRTCRSTTDRSAFWTHEPAAHELSARRCDGGADPVAQADQ